MAQPIAIHHALSIPVRAYLVDASLAVQEDAFYESVSAAKKKTGKTVIDHVQGQYLRVV